MEGETAKIEKGKLIVFEGVEKVGKSTQIKILADRLRQAGIGVVLTKEPRGEIREKLLFGNPTPEQELSLYFEDRTQDFSGIIIPALEKGKWAIVDRCSPSTISYQHYGRGLDLSDIKKRDIAVRQNHDFDLVILLDMDPRESMKRAERETRFEKEDWDFHERVRKGYLAQVKENSGSWLVVDGAKKSEEVSKIIWDEIVKRFL